MAQQRSPRGRNKLASNTASTAPQSTTFSRVPAHVKRYISDAAILPGVVGIVRGFARKGNTPTDEPAFIVLVERKGRDEHDPECLAKYLDLKRRRFRIDVVQVGRLRLALRIDGVAGRGTVAALGPPGENTYALTCAHVVLRDRDNDIDDGDGRSDGTVKGVQGDVIWSRFADSRPCDHAVIKLANALPDVRLHRNLDRLVADLNDVYPGQELGFHSVVRNRWSSGRVVGQSEDEPVVIDGHRFRGVILVEGREFCRRGDSGALVFRESNNFPVGIVIGLSEEGHGIIVPLTSLPKRFRSTFFEEYE